MVIVMLVNDDFAAPTASRPAWRSARQVLLSATPIEALRAALYPERTDYLYFVSMNNGWHTFSSTLDEHNRAVERYQR